MTSYRRMRLPGGTYFFTLALEDRRSSLLTERIDDLRSAFRTVRAAHPFAIEAIVVLPSHLHCLWSLPAGDSDYSTRWRQIKAAFSRAVPAGESVSRSRARRQERGLWQRRFWEHRVRDERGYETRFHYIHYNPVKHGLVRRVRDWPYSSFHRYVRLGVYPNDWARQVGIEAWDMEQG